MANKYHGNLPGNRKYTGGEGGSNAAQGRRGGIPMPEKTADWPGVPGKTQGKIRSGGAPTSGKLGPFHVKKIGI